jgi:hypothetical protein
MVLPLGLSLVTYNNDTICKIPKIQPNLFFEVKLYFLLFCCTSTNILIYESHHLYSLIEFLKTSIVSFIHGHLLVPALWASRD